MNNVIENMLSKYDIKNKTDETNAMKEIIQEIVLCGLSRGGFFDVAAFYGGTALRIFYGLNRFSEDLDFALLEPNKEFDLSKYFSFIEKEVKSYGLNLTITAKQKTKESNITEYEFKYQLLPSPHQIRLYDESSLFAGKIHAVLCRGWNNRVKGRDLYDYIFYLSKNASINIELVKQKLMGSKIEGIDDSFNIIKLKNMLAEKFKQINYTEAKEDILPFIEDTDSLKLWSADFFIEITNELK